MVIGIDRGLFRGGLGYVRLATTPGSLSAALASQGIAALVTVLAGPFAVHPFRENCCLSL
jgi:hypothetical protein